MLSDQEHAELLAEERGPMSEEQIAALFASLARAADVDLAVANLGSRSLRELGGWLMRQGASETNLLGEVMGRVIVEGWKRFTNMQTQGGGR
jgi:hypothetical protein